MAVLNPPLSSGSHLLFPTSIFSSKYSPLFITNWRTNQRTYKFKVPNSNLPFSSNSLLIHTKKIRISSQLSRPSKRRNYLREKLTHHQPNQPPKVDEVSSNPPTDYDNTTANYSNFDKYTVEGNNDVKIEPNYESNEYTDDSLDELKLESLGESDLRNKLESWADQYKADLEFWGIGYNPIFTVFQNEDGKVDKVLVNEDEILERNGIERTAYRQNRLDIDFADVNSKISHAKFLAREMEIGNYEIPKSSSLAKVIALGKTADFSESIQRFSIPSNLPMKRLSKLGMIGLFAFFAIWATRALFVRREDPRLEKEMLRRKIKARKEKENLVKGNVEVIFDPLDKKMTSAERPRIDKEELLSRITKAKLFGEKLVVQESTSYQNPKSNEFDAKVREIRAMARRAREIEREESSSGDGDEKGEFDFDDVSDKVKVVEKGGERVANLTNGLSNSHFTEKSDVSKILVPFFSNDLKDDRSISSEETLVNNDDDTQTSDSSQIEASGGGENVINPEKNDTWHPMEDSNAESTTNKSGTVEVKDSFNTLNGQEVKAKRGFEKKPRVITSVREAKEFLSRKSEKEEPVEEDEGKIMPKNGVNLSNQDEKETNINTKQSLEKGNRVPEKNISDMDSKTIPSENNENLMEKNFRTMEPVFKKIGGGFRENYDVAREKVKQELDITPMNLPDFDEDDDGELDWMKDDRLREIVFQVRDNELLGRDPFYLMDEEDKVAFFEGLEKKVEKENKNLSKLHDYLHANIENLDYGADGMSVYDPPEKIIPRWKGPPVKHNQNPEFLENFAAQRKALANEIFSNLDIESENGLKSLDKMRETPSIEKISPKSDLNDRKKESPKTVIEGSDGSLRAGKKSGKEFWEHTKKWSQGFLESYNAETDPKIKAVMKDIGKDLDRWITPKEIQEAADLMDKLPEKNKEFIEKKLNKVKREMELFGPQAVLSKYKEYGNQKEEDHLWWLDLPFVLCIELYTIDNGENRIGLYSLEMAEDLELEPKPIHVIAFEDAGDCKNLCYIIQSHLEMLGNGNAFVVARPPKDAFREAKANGFSVTVIRKGELQLNVDQALEEVEEQITEIGTKIYHDKIMGEQSVDMGALMKGVFGANKPSKRRNSRQKLKKPTKH